MSTNISSKLKVCYFGTYRANYARNQIMIAGLRLAGVEVIECHVPLWKSIEDRVQAASGGWASPSFIKRFIMAYFRLIKQYISLDKDYDLMILGYPGQADVFLARILTWWQRKPLVLDMLMSIYLVAIERDLAAKSPLSMRLLYGLEWLSCRLPDLLIANTDTYQEWLMETYQLPAEKFGLVTMGVDDQIFKPIVSPPNPSTQFTALYYGTFIPNHGAEVIIEAAKLLQTQKDVHFQLIGDGPTKTACQKLAETYQLNNVTFIDWLPKENLSSAIASADVVLGVFSETTQSKMTIHNKIYEGLAMQKPVITGFSETIANIFQHERHIYLIERTNPLALAEAITHLKNKPDLRKYLSEQGYSFIMNRFTIAQLGLQFEQQLTRLRQRTTPMDNISQTIQAHYEKHGWQRTQEGRYKDDLILRDDRSMMQEYYEPSYRRLDPYFQTTGDYFLDAASGGYPAAQYSKAYKWHVCVDFAAAGLEEARRNLGNKGLYVVADIAHLPFKDDSFAGSISSHTLYHLPPNKQPLAVAEYFRTLKPKSNLIILYISGYLLNSAKFIRQIWRKLTGTTSRHHDPVLATPPVWAIPPTQFSQHLPQAKVDVFSYRLLHQRISSRFIPNNGLGKRLLNLCVKLEEMFPRALVPFSYYIVVAIQKKSHDNIPE